MINEKTYKILRYYTQIVMPAASGLYLSLSKLWGLPHPVEVVGTFAALEAFLGIVLLLDSKKYFKNTSGTLTLDVSDDEDALMNIKLPELPQDIAKRNQVLMNVIIDNSLRDQIIK